MLALLGAAAALALQTQPGSCRGTLCYADSLRPFLDKLRAGRPVHILQIGDSHTAGDMVTNGWRTRLQARYGNGGRGVLAAGRPYAGYLTWSVTAQQSPGWLANASFGPAYRADGPAIGLSGFTQSTAAAGQTLSVSADSPDEDFDRIVVCALTGPGAGTLMLGMDEAQEVWPLDAPAPAASCRTMDHDVPVGSATINTVDARPVSITSFATFRRGGGVTLSNLGVVGAQLVHFARTSDAVVQAELAAYRPDLIVLAFGTNEGFDTDLPPAEYEAALRGQIARLRRLAGHDVPILLLGPPDAAARQPAGLAGACGDGWSVPAGLGAVRARQLRVARELRLAFWDWAAAMGGRCASSAWRASDEMRGDHVHFTRSGGDRIGAMLDADIARALELEPAGDAEGRGR